MTDIFSEAWVLRHAPISSNVARSDEVLKMPLTKGTKLSNEGEIVDTSTIITPYGKISSVLEVFKRQKSPEGEGYDGLYYRHLFFTKGIGIVKYEYTNNQTWELLDYKLN